MLSKTFWEQVPPLDVHDYIDSITIDSPMGNESARDTEMEALVGLLCVLKDFDHKQFKTRVSVRRNLLGQWSDDNHSSFSAEEVMDLRRVVVPLLQSLDGAQVERLKNLFSL